MARPAPRRSPSPPPDSRIRLARSSSAAPIPAARSTWSTAARSPRRRCRSAGPTGTAHSSSAAPAPAARGQAHRRRVGAGRFTLNGGAAYTATNATVGSTGSGNGSVLIDGPGSVWTVSSQLLVGSNSGCQGAVSVLNGGAIVGNTAVVGNLAGSIGAVNVDGFSSRWTNSGFILIGSTGAGSVTVSNGGTMTSGNLSAVGNSTGANGHSTCHRHRLTVDRRRNPRCRRQWHGKRHGRFRRTRLHERCSLASREREQRFRQRRGVRRRARAGTRPTAIPLAASGMACSLSRRARRRAAGACRSGQCRVRQRDGHCARSWFGLDPHRQFFHAVGSLGTGASVIENGGRVDSSLGHVLFAALAGSTGALRVSGAGSRLNTAALDGRIGVAGVGAGGGRRHNHRHQLRPG